MTILRIARHAISEYRHFIKNHVVPKIDIVKQVTLMQSKILAREKLLTYVIHLLR